jgi:hypothetical protein
MTIFTLNYYYLKKNDLVFTCKSQLYYRTIFKKLENEYKIAKNKIFEAKV